MWWRGRLRFEGEMLQELNLGLAAPCSPRELPTCPCRGANRVLETSLEFAVVLVCALNLSSASSAARRLGRWDAGRAGPGCWKRDFVGVGQSGAESRRGALGAGVESRVAGGMRQGLLWTLE